MSDSEHTINIHTDTDQPETDLSNLAGLFGTLGATVAGFAAGAVVALGAFAVALGVKSVNAANDLDTAVKKMGKQFGSSAEEMQEFEDTIKNIYSANLGASFDDIADSVAEIKKQTKLSGKSLEDFTKKALKFSDVFGKDIQESTRTADNLMKNFGLTSEESFNLMTQGAQQGLDKNGDMLDIVSEYSTQFEALGFNAEDMFNALIAGADSGAFSLDKVGDMFKEFNIRAKDGSKATAEAFKTLGLDADEMTKAFAEGGKKARDAYTKVTDALRELDDPIQKNQVGVALMGTTFEDLEATGVDSITLLADQFNRKIPSVERLNDVKYKDFGSAMEGVKRQFEVGILVPLGQAVLPLINKFANALNKYMPQAVKLFSKVANYVSAVFAPIIKKGFKDIVNAFTSAGVSMSDVKLVIIGALSALKPIVTAVAGLWKSQFSFIASVAIPYLIRAVKRLYPAFKTAFKSIVSAIVTFYNAFSKGIKIAERIYLSLKKVIAFNSKAIKAVLGALKIAFRVFVAYIKSRLNSAKSPISGLKNAFKSMNSYIGSKLSSIKSKIKSAVSYIKNKLKGLKSSGYTYGRNFISQFAKGLASKITYLKNKARAAANVIKSYLGWSSPTEAGPGAKSDEWAPNLMQMLGDGMLKNKGELINAATTASMGINQNLNSAPIYTGGAGIGGVQLVNLNAYDTPTVELITQRVVRAIKRGGR